MRVSTRRNSEGTGSSDLLPSGLCNSQRIPIEAIRAQRNIKARNPDIADLTKKAVDLKKGLIEYPREKTGAELLIPLWPETIQAIRDAVASRPGHDSPYLFVSAKGQDYADQNRTGYRGTGEFR